jgi:starvation-inducible outer membrane lipoprotein
MKNAIAWRPISMWVWIGLLALLMSACGTVVAPPAAEAPVAGEAAESSAAAPVATSASETQFSGELVINTWNDITADPAHPSYALHELMSP